MPKMPKNSDKAGSSSVKQRTLASKRLLKTRASVKKEAVSDTTTATHNTSPILTNAEKRASDYATRATLREQRLRADPHADVRGPELVACRLCGQHIKLSTRVSYDAFHWTTHVERCARRTPASREKNTLQIAKRNKQVVQLPEKCSNQQDRPRTRSAAYQYISESDHTGMEAESSAGNTDMRALSSPLSSPPPDTPSPDLPLQPILDGRFDEYIERTGRTGTLKLAPYTLEDASKWSWSMLKEATWGVETQNQNSFDDGFSLG